MWIVCASAGGLKPHLVDSLHGARARGAVVTMGPRAPALDGAMQPLKRPVDVRGFEIEPLDDIARADVLVARRIDELGLPTWPTDPIDAHVTVHEDSGGAPRVVFVMNPTARDLVVRVSLAGIAALVDALAPREAGAAGRVARDGGAFEVRVPARVARMMTVET